MFLAGRTRYIAQRGLKVQEMRSPRFSADAELSSAVADTSFRADL